MVNKADTNKARLHRHKRVRGKISGTAARPRLNVFRSTNHIYAQLIDDVKGVTRRRLASSLPNVPLKRAFPRSYSTAAAIFSTAASKSWPKAPVRAASSSKRRRNTFG